MSPFTQCPVMHLLKTCSCPNYEGDFVDVLDITAMLNIYFDWIMILQDFPNVILTCCFLGNHILWWVSLRNLTAIFNLLFLGGTNHGFSISIHFVWMIKIFHLIVLFMQCLFNFSDMRAYREKSFFCYFAAVSNIRKTKKLFERDSNYGLADYSQGNFLYF